MRQERQGRVTFFPLFPFAFFPPLLSLKLFKGGNIWKSQSIIEIKTKVRNKGTQEINSFNLRTKRKYNENGKILYLNSSKGPKLHTVNAKYYGPDYNAVCFTASIF